MSKPTSSDSSDTPKPCFRCGKPVRIGSLGMLMHATEDRSHDCGEGWMEEHGYSTAPVSDLSSGAPVEISGLLQDLRDQVAFNSRHPGRDMVIVGTASAQLLLDAFAARSRPVREDGTLSQGLGKGPSDDERRAYDLERVALAFWRVISSEPFDGPIHAAILKQLTVSRSLSERPEARAITINGRAHTTGAVSLHYEDIVKLAGLEDRPDVLWTIVVHFPYTSTAKDCSIARGECVFVESGMSITCVDTSRA